MERRKPMNKPHRGMLGLASFFCLLLMSYFSYGGNPVGYGLALACFLYTALGFLAFLLHRH